MNDDIKFVWLVIVTAIIIAVLFWGFSCIEAQEKEQPTPAYVIQWIDGDTAWLGIATKVRIANIDTPETFRPTCPEEKALGLQATEMANQIMPRGSLVFLEGLKHEADKYKRALARVATPDGQDIGDLLIAHGLAKPWKGKRHKWCEELQKNDKGKKEKKIHARW